MIYGMKIHRASIELQLKSALNRSSAVVLLGPRQVGKTTLAKKIVQELPDAIYLDLEKAADLRKLDDSGGFLRHQDKGLTVLDEVHRVPQLFAELRSVIDERREKGAQIGQFLLLGSASLDLIQKASETLAGRVSNGALISYGAILNEIFRCLHPACRQRYLVGFGRCWRIYRAHH
jgi:uncharacterized protein